MACDVSPVAMFSLSNVLSNCLHERMHRHTGCICLTFLCHVSEFSLPCVWIFSAVSFQIACLRGYIITLVALVSLFPLCVFKCVVKLPAWGDAKPHWLHYSTFLHCESSNGLPRRVHNHNGCICLTFFPLCVSKCALKLSAWKEAKSQW